MWRIVLRVKLYAHEYVPSMSRAQTFTRIVLCSLRLARLGRVGQMMPVRAYEAVLR